MPSRASCRYFSTVDDDDDDDDDAESDLVKSGDFVGSGSEGRVKTQEEKAYHMCFKKIDRFTNNNI